MAEPTCPQEALPWLAKADSDLRTARAALALDPPETETAAFLSLPAGGRKVPEGPPGGHDLDPPRVHDLAVLLEMCADQGHDLTDLRGAILDLNPFAVQFRYPTEEEAPEEEEVRAGLETAVSIRQQIQSLLPDPPQAGETN